MSTNASAETIAKFKRGEFWEGVEAWCAERIAVAERAAINAASWESALKAQGAKAEIQVLQRLFNDVQKVSGETTTAAAPQK